MYPSGPGRLVTGTTQRIPEHLENLKADFESLAHDVNMYKMQRDDYERKLQAQLGELNSIQQTLYELERNHQKIKQQYEEEILRLRRQLELINPGAIGSSPYIGNQTPPSVPLPLPGTSSSQPQQGKPFTPTPPTGLDKGLMNPNGFYTGLAPIKGPNFQSPSGPTKRMNEDFYPAPSIPGLSQISSGEPSLPPSKMLKTSESSKEPVSVTLNENNNPPPESQPKDQLKMETSKNANSDNDWVIGVHPGVQTNMNIQLLHDFEHSSVVCCVRFSNDGKTLATGCNKSAQIYDVDTGEKIHLFVADSAREKEDLYIRSVCFSPDNKYLAAGAEDKTVKVWDIENKRLKHTFLGHEVDIYSVDWSKDGNFIVSGSGDKKAKIWNLEKKDCVFTLGNEEVGPKDGVTSVAFSPDGRYVAAGSLDRIVRLWDAQTGYFLERYEGHLDSVYSVAFSPDGKTLASGSLDKTLKLWDLTGRPSRSRCRSTFTGHKDFVLSVAFSHDGNWLISGSKDRSVQFWDPRTAQLHLALQGHKNSVISVAVSPLGGLFATGSGDTKSRLWKYEC